MSVNPRFIRTATPCDGPCGGLNSLRATCSAEASAVYGQEVQVAVPTWVHIEGRHDDRSCWNAADDAILPGPVVARIPWALHAGSDHLAWACGNESYLLLLGTALAFASRRSLR
eukprot:6720704-Prymnesium_polylepis.1